MNNTGTDRAFDEGVGYEPDEPRSPPTSTQSVSGGVVTIYIIAKVGKTRRFRANNGGGMKKYGIT